MPGVRFVAVAAAGAAVLVVLAVPMSASAVMATQSSVVSAVPAAYTPAVNNGQVNAIGQSGTTVVLGGTFTSVTPHGTSRTFTDSFLTAFSAGTGARVSGFAPSLNGTVDAVLAGPTTGTVYVAGSFSTIDGVKSKVALISASTGAIVSGWKSPAINGEVNAVALNGDLLYIGGLFTTVGSTSHAGLAVLNATSGAVAGTATPAFVGHHNYGVNCNPSTQTCSDAGTGIKALDVNPAGTRLVAIGNFTSAGGLSRNQIALLDVSSSTVSVDRSWATAAYTAACVSSSYDTYVRDVQFSADGSYFVVAATGGGAGQKNSDGTQTSCDTASRWDISTTGSDVRPTWIDYTGNDTFLSVAITGTAVYVGGHQRWVNNSEGSDNPGEGAVPRPGIVALDPVNGMPLAWNPGRNPRGAGAYALFASSDGLYVGSDTDYIGNSRYKRPKIAFFPLAGGYDLAPNSAGTLPGALLLLGSGTSTATARSVTYSAGSAPGAPRIDSSVNWSTARGAFEINNEVYYGDTDGNFYMRSFNGTTFGPAVAIDPYDDPTWDNIQTGSGQTFRGTKSAFYSEMSSLTSMFYSNGRVYYTLAGKTQMFWRWFEPDSGVMGADEFTLTDGHNWSHVAGAFLSGTTLYYADSLTKSLFQIPFTNGQPTGTATLADASIDWTSHGAFVQPRPAIAVPRMSPAPQVGVTEACSGSAAGGGTISYAWNLNGTRVATGPSYRPVGVDFGKSLSCTATVTTGSGATNSATSKSAAVALGAALTATTRPHLTGHHHVGTTERARHGTWSPTAARFTYRWYVGSMKLAHATRPTLRLTASERGRRLTCRVTAHRPGYASRTVRTVAVRITK